MIYVTGDLHGNFSILSDFANSEKGKCLTKNDYVIVLGDFGIWHETIETIKNLNSILNYTLLFIEGNHDHPIILESFPEERLFGGSVHNIYGVYHLRRSEIYSIPTETGDLTIAVCGGGDSKDKDKRIKGVSWFEQEKISEADVKKLLGKAAEYNMQVDYFLSHTLSCAVKFEWNYECSSCSLGNGSFFELTESDFRIRDIVGQLNARMYLSAHEHVDREFSLVGKHYRSVYKDFVKL